jgi:hypothetical protein
LGTDRRRFFLTLAAGALLALPPAVLAQQTVPKGESLLVDPYVPPELRSKASEAEPTHGEQLRAQVRAKLKRRFEAAASPDGTLTARQARSAGLGAIADRFDAIDRAGRGVVRFEDYERFLELGR